MSCNSSPPPSNAPPNAPPSHESLLLAVVLQGIAQVLLDHGSAQETSTPEANTCSQEPSRQAKVFGQIAQLLSGEHHCCNLHEYVDDIYAELYIIMELLSCLNGNTNTSALDLHVLRKNLSEPLRKLEELSLQLESSHLQNKVTTPKQ